jgi:hypothetical protein
MKINNIIIFAVLASFIAAPVYAKKDKDKDKGNQLPPGLQKKAEKGKPLPPGWQKKLAKGEIMDKDVYRQSQIVVPVDSHGLVTVRIEGKLVKLYKATREIVEILE